MIWSLTGEVNSLIASVGRGIAWGAAATTAAVTTVVVTTGVVVYHSVEATKAELAANQADQDLAKAQDRLNQRLVNQKKQQQQPASNTQPNPQTPPAPQMAADHDRNKRRSTKDKHEKRRPGTSPPPNYKPDRNYVQPKDDKKKDKEKPPYHRKDRDKKQEGS